MRGRGDPGDLGLPQRSRATFVQEPEQSTTASGGWPAVSPYAQRPLGVALGRIDEGGRVGTDAVIRAT